MEVCDWKKDSVLGEGCFGVVLLGISAKPNLDHHHHHHHHHHRVAIKVAYCYQAHSLHNEQLILKNFIGCPEIVQYITDEVTIEGGYHVYNLVLEYAAGGSLDDMIKERKKLPEDEVKEYLRMMLRGLSCLHAKGFVHCDLKPSNILVFPSSDGKMKLKLADFGLSEKYECEEEERQNSHRDYRLSFKGTPEYMSPESLSGEIKPALDIWSLGCVLINMISGKKSWNCYDQELISKLVHEKQIPIIPEELSDQGKDFLQKCFERNPNQRSSANILLQHPYLVIEQDY